MNTITFVLCTLLAIATSGIHARRVGSCVRNIQGSRCSQPGAQWQHDGVCIIDSSNTGSCHVPDTRVFQFSLVAKIRQKNKLNGAKPITKLWVRGSGPTLSWEKPKKMLKSGRYVDTWSTGITYSSDSNSLLCLNSSHCSLNQGAIEFRIYRDEVGKDSMLGPNFYIKLPISNSMAGALGFIPPQVKVYPWFDSGSVVAQKVSLPYISYFNRAEETILFNSTILYPPSFQHNIHKSYPLLVMFGTNEPLHIAPLLEHMYIHEASIEEAVIVSIHYLDKAPFCAFNPFTENNRGTYNNVVWNCKTGDKECHTCQTCWDDQRVEKCEKLDFETKSVKCLAYYSCTGPAGDILDFIQIKLLPELQKRMQNRLQLDFPRGERMSVLGFSGGGLLACFAALSRPFYYKNAACLSAPFQWPIAGLSPPIDRNIEGMGTFMHNLNTTLNIEPTRRALYVSQKYYLDVGEKDNFYLPHIDAHNYTEWVIKLINEVLHLETGTNVVYSNVPNAGNSYYHHKDGGTEILNRIRYPLIYFIGATGGPNKKFARAPKIDDASFIERGKELGINEQDLSTLIDSAGNKSQVKDGSCLDVRRWMSKDRHSSVPVPVFLVTVGKCFSTIMCTKELL